MCIYGWRHLDTLINSAAWATLMVARGILALVAVEAVASVSLVIAGFVMMSLVTAGVAGAGFMMAGFMVLVGTVSWVSSWLVFTAPLRALRALEALLRVLAFTGRATLTGSTVLALVTAGFTVLTVSFTGWATLTGSTVLALVTAGFMGLAVSFTGWVGLAGSTVSVLMAAGLMVAGLTVLTDWVAAMFASTAVLPASAAAFSSAAIMARVLRPEYTLAVLESATGAGVEADLVFLRVAGTLAVFEAATGAEVEAGLMVFLRPAGTLAIFEAATGAGVEADLVFLRGAMVSRVLWCLVKVSGKLGNEVKWLYVVVRVLVVESVLWLVNGNWRKEGRVWLGGSTLSCTE
jgi:hypothetical protein